jgi:DNA-binding response OmpR family regulator
VRAWTLVAEDAAAIVAFVAMALERERYAVVRVHTGREALSHVQCSAPDLALLDLMLPGDMDGLQVCQVIRRGETYVPIIKPFNTREPLARVRAVLRLAT